MTWWNAVPLLLASLAVLLLPGGAGLASIGVRGLPLLALAPAISFAIIGGSAILVGFLGVPWQPWFVLVATVAAVGIGLLLRRWAGPSTALSPAVPPGSGRIYAVGGVVAALVGAVPLAAGMREVDRVPQTWDTVFHLNAIRYIEDTGQASTFLLNGMTNHESDAGFYPAGFHASAAMVVELLGADPAAVANVMALVLGGLVVPAGTALAARALMPDWRWAAGIGAVAGSVFAALPAMMISWGTLWPNAWATGMLPGLLAATLLCLRRPDVPSWLAVVVGIGGAALGHPTAIFAMALLGAPLVVHALGSRWSNLRAPRRLWAEVVLLVTAVVAVFLVVTRSSVLDAVRNFRWGQAETAPQAVGEALLDSPLSTLGHGARSASWLLAALLVLGVIRAAGEVRHRAWLISLAVAIGAFVISAGADPADPLRDYVTVYWYNDPVRLAGLVPVAAAPVVAIGFRAVAEWLEGLVLGRLRGPARAGAVVRLVTVPVVVLAFLLTTGAYAQKREDRLTFWYWPTVGEPGRQLVTPAEQDLLRRMDELIPPDALVLADPFTGGALAYALGERDVLFPHLTGTWSSTARRAVGLMPDLVDPRTCFVLQDLGVDYLYVDTEQYVEGDGTQRRFRDLDRAPSTGVTLVDRADTAALYELTACG